MNTAITAKGSAKVRWNLPEPPKVRMRDQFADWMRAKNYARNTITAYVADVLDFVVFSGKRDPRTLGAPEVQAFLSMLANQRDVTWKIDNGADWVQNSDGYSSYEKPAANADHQSAGAFHRTRFGLRSDTSSRVMPARDKGNFLLSAAFFRYEQSYSSGKSAHSGSDSTDPRTLKASKADKRGVVRWAGKLSGGSGGSHRCGIGKLGKSETVCCARPGLRYGRGFTKLPSLVACASEIVGKWRV